MRIATYNTELERDGPGILLRDIRRGKDPQVAAVAMVIARVQPDIVLLQGIDYDHEGAALSALADLLATQGALYPYRFALPPNSGQRTGFDHDGNGRLNEARDAQGYGRFPGQGGMALLSRYRVLHAQVRDFSALLWRDLPGASLPRVEGQLFPDPALYDVLRLSSVAHWEIPIEVHGQTLHLLGFHATPPVFDGPEDRNGLRNADQIRFWQLYLDGALPGQIPPETGFVVLGNANLDPHDGDGRHEAIRALLQDPRLQDLRPESPGAAMADAGQHQGPSELDSVDWNEPSPGNLRVDYVLPSADLKVRGAGTHWPKDDPVSAQASRHRLVWVDILWPQPGASANSLAKPKVAR